MRLVMVDNYDSFTFNLVQAFGELGADVLVLRPDAVDVDAWVERRPGALVVSPGPGRPEPAGASLRAVQRFAEAGIPVFGVCLGIQAIAEAFGARLRAARRLMHGKTSWVHHDGRGVFRSLPSPFEAARYHSLAVCEASCPPALRVSAHSDDGEVMGLRHRTLPVEGVQFHPESILTREGKHLLRNVLELCAESAA